MGERFKNRLKMFWEVLNVTEKSPGNYGRSLSVRKRLAIKIAKKNKTFMTSERQSTFW